MPLVPSSSVPAVARTFHALAQRLGAPAAAVSAAWSAVESAYTAPGRRYHTLAHLAHGLGALEAARPALDLAPAELDLVTLAFFFHDVVYAVRPFAKSEAKSAAVARTHLEAFGLPASSVARVTRMIEGTAGHGGEVDAATALLFDVDLAILGAEPLAYAQFEADVREEYGVVPFVPWVHLRRMALNGYRKRTTLYRTAAFAERFDARARENLALATRDLDFRNDPGRIRLHEPAGAPDEAGIVYTRRAALDRFVAWRDVERVQLWMLGAPELLLFLKDGELRSVSMAWQGGGEAVAELVARPGFVPEDAAKGPSGPGGAVLADFTLSAGGPPYRAAGRAAAAPRG